MATEYSRFGLIDRSSPPTPVVLPCAVSTSKPTDSLIPPMNYRPKKTKPVEAKPVLGHPPITMPVKATEVSEGTYTSDRPTWLPQAGAV